MGIFRSEFKGFGKSFQEIGSLSSARLRAQRSGDTLGAKIAGQKIENLQSQRKFGLLSFRRSLGGQLTPGEQKEFDTFRRANLRRLRKNPLRS